MAVKGSKLLFHLPADKMATAYVDIFFPLNDERVQAGLIKYTFINDTLR